MDLLSLWNFSLFVLGTNQLSTIEYCARCKANYFTASFYTLSGVSCFRGVQISVLRLSRTVFTVSKNARPPEAVVSSPPLPFFVSCFPPKFPPLKPPHSPFWKFTIACSVRFRDEEHGTFCINQTPSAQTLGKTWQIGIFKWSAPKQEARESSIPYIYIRRQLHISGGI